MSYLTLCIIVKNAAETLAHCLDSVQGLVDHTLVVDTGSTDDTVALAQRHDVELRHFDWCDHFAAARNAGLAEVQSDWILALDADEALLPESIPALRTQLQHLDPQAQPWQLNLSFVRGRHTQLKRALWSGHFGLRFQGRVHETLVLPDGGEPQQIDCWKVRVQHESAPLAQNPHKAKFYLQLIETELRQDAPPPRRQAELYWHQASALRALKSKSSHKEQVVNALSQAIAALNRAGWREQYFDHLLLLRACHDSLNLGQDPHTALPWAQQAVALLPRQAEGWFYLAWLEFWHNDLNAAWNALQTCAQRAQQPQKFLLLKPQQLKWQWTWLEIRLLSLQGQWPAAVAKLEALYRQVPEQDFLYYRILLAFLMRDPESIQAWWQAQGRGHAKPETIWKVLQGLNIWNPSERQLCSKAIL